MNDPTHHSRNGDRREGLTKKADQMPVYPGESHWHLIVHSPLAAYPRQPAPAITPATPRICTTTGSFGLPASAPYKEPGLRTIAPNGDASCLRTVCALTDYGNLELSRISQNSQTQTPLQWRRVLSHAAESSVRAEDEAQSEAPRQSLRVKLEELFVETLVCYAQRHVATMSS